VAQRLAINDAYYDGRLQRSLNLPLPVLSPPRQSEDAGDTSDMNLSDAGQHTAADTLRRDTHAFSAEEAIRSRVETRDTDASTLRGDSDGENDGEESRYASKPRRPISDTITRTYNRFESLADQTVQYVMSDSDEGSWEGGRSQTAHANKRRRIESEVRPGQVRRASKRSYWASKVQAE
jgi:hypothetical protein